MTEYPATKSLTMMKFDTPEVPTLLFLQVLDARVFSEGLAAMAPCPGTPGMNSAYGYIDRSGAIVKKPQFFISGNNLAADFV